jgi:hypothetical protein
VQGSSSIRFRLITTLPRHGALYSFANLVVGTRLPLRPSATCELLKGVTVHPTCTAPSFCTYRRPVEVLYLLHLTCLHPYHILQATNSYARLLPSPGLPASQPASQPASSVLSPGAESLLVPALHPFDPASATSLSSYEVFYFSCHQSFRNRAQLFNTLSENPPSHWTSSSPLVL